VWQSLISRVGPNHIYNMHGVFWRGNHRKYGHVWCVYTVLATPTYCFDMMAWEPPYAIHTHTHTLRWPVMVNVLRCLERGAAILHSKGATLLLRGFSGWLCASLVCIMRRVGQNRIYTYIYTVYLVVSKPKIPYVHRIYMVLANPNHAVSCYYYFLFSVARQHTLLETNFNLNTKL